MIGKISCGSRSEIVDEGLLLATNTCEPCHRLTETACRVKYLMEKHHLDQYPGDAVCVIEESQLAEMLKREDSDTGTGA